MNDLKSCAACGKKQPEGEMKTCMHNQMHRYVCDTKCMNDFYNPMKKQISQMTNKPTVQAYLHTGTEDAGQRGVSLNHDKFCTNLYMKTEPLILLSDHEAARAADEERISELKGLLRKLHSDLLMRAEVDADGVKVVNLSNGLWCRVAALAQQEQKP